MKKLAIETLEERIKILETQVKVLMQNLPQVQSQIQALDKRTTSLQRMGR